MKLIRKIFLFIKWKIYDFQNPPIARPYGITCYVGLPGKGKTLSLVQELFSLKARFPKAKIYTNFGFIHQDGEIKGWKDLVEINNGDDGVIFGLDEVHDLFGRKDWSKMPPEILSLFSQNRKHAKQFLCTAQAYADIGIDLRRRCHYIIECRNWANRWIRQLWFRPEDYKEFDGQRTMRVRAKRTSFIATNDIYNAYDTYALINAATREERLDVNFVVTKIS